ncbi:MAG: Helix-turn-helix domain [Verrucomicrobiota bacterium]|jgi:cytoskeletal protein RodZ
MEGLGKKLKEARLARNLTLDEAGRLTKIRPGRLEEIENEDFSQFASLAYAKGFLLIYGKFLEVDVSPYLEAFETSEHVTVDGYAYLQETPESMPSRPVVVRRPRSSGERTSLWPFVIGVLVLVIGFTVMKSLLQVQRLKPRPSPTPGFSPVATETASDKIIAPHALPVESTTPAATDVSSAAPTPPPTVAPTSTPHVPSAPAAEPEVRRAEPVHPDEVAKQPPVTPRPTASPRKSPRRVTPTPAPRPTVLTTPRAR